MRDTAMVIFTAPPCVRHAAADADCGDCRALAFRALDLLDKLAALACFSETGRWPRPAVGRALAGGRAPRAVSCARPARAAALPEFHICF
jgi:hypothetical protein